MAEMNATENPGGEQAAQPVSTTQPQAARPADEAKVLDRDARMWAMFCHLAGVGGFLPIVPVLGSIIAPLIIWQIKKDDYEFVNEQGKEAVNFQISILIYALVAGLLCFICAGFALLPAVYIFDVVLLIIAAIKVNDGQHYKYPLTIRFIK
jgi:uncharacterized Tic20 family protein